ncbi:hypothetical protein GCM10009127_03540 [Alteraurantiacibacter aestuarii]|uniref:Uncharacterized protein n=1 Tax=Alteraurantiacibacter aestuarii TaxID=650004 RepID=A0A844ZM52_9SPHN|nr:hypothetical protein [Alteraurantiacibacter aestuarii]MXO88392.1 hypothetical protein [Alteraurantiacibacter aestuarii]
MSGGVSAINARYLPALAACAMLCGCGAGDNDPGPGGVSVGEAAALDQAAEMLDQQRLPAEALSEPGDEAPPAAEQAP